MTEMSAPARSDSAASAVHPIRVFLLDDHEVVRRGLRDLLEVEGEFEVVGEASTAAEALAASVMDRLRSGDRKDPLAVLTGQERRILELIGEGLTNRQIGERLFLAEKTVKNYVSSLLAKLGIERRVQAAVLVSELKSGGSGSGGRGRAHR